MKGEGGISMKQSEIMLSFCVPRLLGSECCILSTTSIMLKWNSYYDE